jgi:FkbM family methyltransferase
MNIYSIIKSILVRVISLIRTIIPQSLRKLISRLGVVFGEPTLTNFPSIELTLKYLKEWGYTPQFVVDVGAYCGDWTEMFKTFFPSATILMVEPQASQTDSLKKICQTSNSTVFLETSLLGSVDGQEVQFTEMETGSSVFEENNQSATKNKVTKHLTTLDTVIQKNHGWDRIDFLKIDVQGYELEVLAGSLKYLSTCEFVLMESSLIPVNKGCPLIADVIIFMDKQGFRLLDFCSQIRRKDKALWQTDLLFIKEGSQYLPKAENDKSNW